MSPSTLVAERTARRKRPWPLGWLRRLPLTREGLFWFLIASAMLVTGLIKNINLITLLACFLVTLVALNYYLARRQLRSLSARRLLHEPIFALTPYQWIVEVRDGGKKPVSEIRIEDGAGPRRLQWFIPHLPGSASLVVRREVLLPRRGRFTGRSLTLSCGYPLGLAHVFRQCEEEQALIVLPRLGHLHQGVLRRLLGRQSPSLGEARGHACHFLTAQAEFHGLRPYRPGDSPRHIHWRTSARRDELMVREFEELPNDNLILIVDAWCAGDTEEDDPILERTLSLAATIGTEWCRQKGDRFALVMVGSQLSWLAGVTGRPLALALL
jgi:uncharacterized protein (DUF58 family)